MGRPKKVNAHSWQVIGPQLNALKAKLDAIAKAAQAVADAPRDNPTPGQLAALRGALVAAGVPVRSQRDHLGDWPCPQRGCSQTDGLPCAYEALP